MNKLMAAVIVVTALVWSSSFYGGWIERFKAGNITQQILSIVVVICAYYFIYSSVKLIRRR